MLFQELHYILELTDRARRNHMASPFDDDDWMPSESEVESLALERAVRPNETDEDLGERLIREAAPKAAM